MPEKMIEMIIPQKIMDSLCTAKVHVNPRTFQPTITVTFELTYELLQDIRAGSDGKIVTDDEMALLLGKSLMNALDHTRLAS